MIHDLETENRAEIHPGARGAYAVALSAVLLVTVWMLVVASWGRNEAGRPAVVVVLTWRFRPPRFSVSKRHSADRIAGAVAALAVSPLFVGIFERLFGFPISERCPLACLGGAAVLTSSHLCACGFQCAG